jgi:hypothetical protein
MRLAVVVSIYVWGCGTEPSRSPDASTPNTSDGTINPNAGTPCEQATQHSDLAWIQDHVFSASCAVKTCHTEDNQAGGLVLAKGMAHDNLVDKPSTVQSGWTRVIPGDPTHSYLLVALGGEPGTPPDGSVMPWGGLPMLCSQEIDAIERWIAAGAPP